MAKIKNAKVKTSSGGFTRIFDDEHLGNLISKIQSTSITNGNELEKLIVSRANSIDDLDDFLYNCKKDIVDVGSYLCTKKVIKKSLYSLSSHEPDLIVFEINKNGDKNCYIIELKDGDNFDTKKSLAEYNSLVEYKNHLGSKIQFVTNYYICSFNQSDKENITKGFKGKFNINEVMTGKELCLLLNIEYDEIIKFRKNDALDNFDYFCNEL
ncbi:MAG: restriction endonuclease, partial [Peptostreptococcaceae bacterium]|nr:restriction endonuclease [Peptostreptococcaceae bacterium]